MDLLNMNFDMTGIMNGASTFVGWVVIFFWIIVALLLLWGVMYLLSFKTLVRIRQSTASGYVIIDTKAREFTTRDGVKKWRFLKLSWIKLSVIAPPVDYIEFTSKGKFSIEADRGTDGTIVWRKRNKLEGGNDSFTSEERMITAGEMRRANDYKKDSWTDKLWQMGPAIAIMIVMVLVFAFYGDITKVGTQTIAQGTAANTKLAETCSVLFSKIESCDCTVSNSSIKVDYRGGNVPPVPPN